MREENASLRVNDAAARNEGEGSVFSGSVMSMKKERAICKACFRTSQQRKAQLTCAPLIAFL